MSHLSPTELKTRKETRALEMATSAVVATDLADFAGIFAMHAFDFTKILFEQIARFIMLPAAAALTVAKAGLSWRTAYLKKWEPHATAKATVDTLSAGMIATAVTCVLVLGASFGFAGPALFASSFGVGFIFNFVSGCVFTHKARTAMNAKDRMDNTKKAINAWLGALVCAMAAAAVVTVVIFGYMPLAIMGVVAGSIGVTAGILHFSKVARTKPGAPDVVPPAERLSSEATMQRRLLAKSRSEQNLLLEADDQQENSTRIVPRKVSTTLLFKKTISANSSLLDTSLPNNETSKPSKKAN